jgi:hypothetical protein
MDSNRILFSENKNSKRNGLLVMFVGVAVFALGISLGQSHSVFLATGLVTGIVGFMAGLIYLSLGMYSKIILTSEQLKIGNTTIAVKDIDHSFGAKSAWEAMSPAEVDSLSGIVGPNSSLIGGGWGKSYGSKLIAIKLTGGAVRTISSYKSHKLLEALNNLLGYRPTASEISLKPPKRRLWPAIVVLMLFLVALISLSAVPGANIVIILIVVILLSRWLWQSRKTRKVQK